jgi:hypothetical protein
VSQPEARLVYAECLARTVGAREVWSLGCCGDLVIVTGAEAGCFPLWPDEATARFYAPHWPNLTPTPLTLRLLLRVILRELARQRIPVGIGIAPHPDGVMVEAGRLRRDFLRAKRLLAARPSRAPH